MQASKSLQLQQFFVMPSWGGERLEDYKKSLASLYLDFQINVILPHDGMTFYLLKLTYILV